jgi:hypothetical protein
MLEFPEAWSKLRFPHWRTQLIAYLRDAASGRSFSSEAEFDYLVHFLFDDTEHARPEAAVGLSLLSEEEASALKGFVALVEDLLDRGNQCSEIAKKDTATARRAAHRAVSLILVAGEPSQFE